MHVSCFLGIFKKRRYYACIVGFLNIKPRDAETVDIYVNTKTGVQTTGRVWQPLEILLFRLQRLQMLAKYSVQRSELGKFWSAIVFSVDHQI